MIKQLDVFLNCQTQSYNQIIGGSQYSQFSQEWMMYNILITLLIIKYAYHLYIHYRHPKI